MTRTPLSRSEGQRSRPQGPGRIVAASRLQLVCNLSSVWRRDTDLVVVEGAVVVGRMVRRGDGLDAVESQQWGVGDEHRQPDAGHDGADVASLVERGRVVRTTHDVHKPATTDRNSITTRSPIYKKILI